MDRRRIAHGNDQEFGMCDTHDMDEFARRSSDLTRRRFGAMAVGLGLVAALPRLANAAQTQGADVNIKTPDGTADAYFVHPTKGKFPAVLIWPDIFGLPGWPSPATQCWSSIPFIARRKHRRRLPIPTSTTPRRAMP
jgi:hypothetical protein